MTCGDVETLLDAFLDSELPPPMLVAVARHAAGCGACDEAIRSLTILREALADTVRRDAETVDLSGVWVNVEAAIDSTQRRRQWHQRLRGAPMWAAGLAMAAALALVLMNVDRTAVTAPTGSGERIASASRLPPNHAYIDRLAGRDVLLRREPKSGTTVIWVNHAEDY
jgi:anti-sigma factor RsiW